MRLDEKMSFLITLNSPVMEYESVIKLYSHFGGPLGNTYMDNYYNPSDFPLDYHLFKQFIY